MNILDIILLIPIAWFAYRGFTRGFIIELVSLIALVAGIFLAIHFSWFAAEFLADHFSMEGKTLSIVSFILTFLVVVIIVYAVGKLLDGLVNIIFLGFVNKIFGLAFGILKAAVFLSLALMILNTFDEDETLITRDVKENSLLYKPVASVVPFIMLKFDLEAEDFRLDRKPDSGFLV